MENSVESVWKTYFKALRPLRAGAGAAGSLMGTFRRAWSGGGAAVDRSGARGRGCGGADVGSGGGRVRQGHGAVPTGGMCGCGVGLRPGAVWRALLVGLSLARAFGRCGCGGRFWLACCGGRAVRDAGAAQGALAGFLSERKNA